MRHTHHMVTWAVMLTAVLGCHPQARGEAPFYVYNSSFLNGEQDLLHPPDISGASPTAQPVAAPDATAETPAQARSKPQSTPPALEPVREKTPSTPPARSKPTRSETAQHPKGFNRPKKAAMEVTRKAPPQKVASSDTPSAAHTYNPAHAAEYVMAVYRINGIDLGIKPGDNAIAEIYNTVKEQGSIYHATRPAVGDLVFFHNTFDRNTDNRNNDWYTHIGLIERVEKDGTIYVLSYLDSEVQSVVINLEHPKMAKDDRSGKAWNAKLRARTANDPPFTQYMGGELFAGFGNILGGRTEFVVIDNWTPGMELKAP
ncbi:MAG: hypothetical protein AAFX99_01905 [Myxococcota bacterium]